MRGACFGSVPETCLTLHVPLPLLACRFCILRGHAAGILQLLVMGDYLLSLGSDGQLLTWRLPGRSSTEEVHHPLASMQLPAGFKPTCMAHPDTYINKVG
jgi:U3 small nucleolar RNA-associated protein 21